MNFSVICDEKHQTASESVHPAHSSGFPHATEHPSNQAAAVLSHKGSIRADDSNKGCTAVGFKGSLASFVNMYHHSMTQ